MMPAPRTLALLALAFALPAAIAGDPRAAAPGTAQLAPLLAAVGRGEGRIAPLQLAAWIRDQEPGLRLIDLRSAAEYAADHLPTAERRELGDLPELARGDSTVVLYGAADERAPQAWLLVRQLGHPRVYYLAGGSASWEAGVLHPLLSTAALPPAELRRLVDLSRYFGGAPELGNGPGAITSPLGSLREVAPALAPRPRGGEC
jgi:rhodanese-related sulfurtransferase